MKLRLKLNSSVLAPASAASDRRRILGVLGLGVAHGVWTIELFWRRFLLIFGTLFAVAYLVAATGLWLWLARDAHNHTTWWDVATAPVRWENFRRLRGDAAIERGLTQLRQKEYADAFFNLSAGLARSPGNARGRVAVALMYAASNPQQTVALLEAGLDYSANDPDLLRALFSVYRQQQAEGRARAKMAGLLARNPPLAPAARQAVLLAHATDLATLGQDEELLRFAASLPLPSGDRERLLWVAMQADAHARGGRAAEARAILQQLPASTSPADRARLEATIAFGLGDSNALMTAVRRWRVEAPADPAPYVYGFQGMHKLKRLTLRDLVEREFRENFGHNDAALQMFAAAAVNLDLPEVVQRCLDTAVAARLSAFAFRVDLTEIALRRGDFDTAFRQLRLWERELETLAPAQRAYPEFIARLTRITLVGGEPQIAALESHLSEQRGRATVAIYQLAIRVLESADRAEAALTVARLGSQFYSYSDSLQQAQLRLEPLVAAKAVRRPANGTAASEAAHVALPAGAEEALEAFERHFAQDELTAARDLLRGIRAANPAWAGRVERDLAVQQIRLSVLTLDALSARTAVRAQLDKLRATDDALRLVPVIRTLIAQKRLTEARLLRDELADARGTVREVAEALRALDLPDDLAGYAASAAAALAGIDGALEHGRPAEALRVMEYVRKQAPAWLPGARNELAVREVKMRLALDQRLLALAALKDLVVRTGVPRGAAFKLVRELLAAGEQDRAQLLAREIVKLLPDDAAAAKLLKETEAPRPPE